MQWRYLKWVKRISYVIFFSVSTLLTVNLFWQLGSTIINRVIFAALSIAVEFFKVYTFTIAKYNLQKKTLKAKVIFSGFFALYIGITFLSLTASLAFTLSVIDMQNKSVKVGNMEIVSLENQVEDLDKEIKLKILQISNLPATYVLSIEKASLAVKNLYSKKQEIIQRIVTLRDLREVESSDIFQILGKPIGVSGSDVMFLIMLILSILLEVGIVTTSENVSNEEELVYDKVAQGNQSNFVASLIKDIQGSSDGIVKVDEVKIAPVEESSKSKLYAKMAAYITALLDVENTSGKLNSDSVVAQKTGLSIYECRKIREKLNTLKWEGKPIIESTQGITKTSLSEKEILKVLSIMEKKSKLQ